MRILLVTVVFVAALSPTLATAGVPPLDIGQLRPGMASIDVNVTEVGTGLYYRIHVTACAGLQGYFTVVARRTPDADQSVTFTDWLRETGNPGCPYSYNTTETVRWLWDAPHVGNSRDRQCLDVNAVVYAVNAGLAADSDRACWDP